MNEAIQHGMDDVIQELINQLKAEDLDPASETAGKLFTRLNAMYKLRQEDDKRSIAHEEFKLKNAQEYNLGVNESNRKDDQLKLDQRRIELESTARKVQQELDAEKLKLEQAKLNFETTKYQDELAEKQAMLEVEKRKATVGKLELLWRSLFGVLRLGAGLCAFGSAMRFEETGVFSSPVTKQALRSAINFEHKD